jgi:hypothetical protein
LRIYLQTTKYHNMKALKLIIIALIASMSIFTSCTNKKDDPQPSTPDVENPKPGTTDSLTFLYGGVWFPTSVNDTLLDVVDSVYSLTAKNTFYFGNKSQFYILPFKIDYVKRTYQDSETRIFTLMAYDKNTKKISLSGYYLNGGNNIEKENEYDGDNNNNSGVPALFEHTLSNPLNYNGLSMVLTVKKITNNSIEITHTKNGISRKVLYKRNALRYYLN